MNQNEEVTRKEVQNDVPQVAEFLEYLRWLAERTPNVQLSAQKVWQLYHYAVREDRVWSDVTDELGLPLPEGWA